MATIEKLNDIFQIVFDNDEINIRPEMTANDVDGWDSLSHINLVLAVEKAFNFKFTKKELMTLKNVDDLIKIIDTRTS